MSHQEGCCEGNGVAYTGLLLHVCYDWPKGDKAGKTSAEMSQMSQIHSHRQWKREDGLLGGLQWGCAGLDLEIKSWLCAGLFPTAFSLCFAVQRLSLYDLNWASWHVRAQFHNRIKTISAYRGRKVMWLFSLMDASFKKMWKKKIHCRISRSKQDFLSANKCDRIFL